MELMDYGLQPLDFQNPTVAPPPPDSGFLRRSFVMTSLASGFVVVSNAVFTQAVVTGRSDLVAGEAGLPVSEGEMLAHCAMPAAPGKYPVLLVVQKIFGVHEHIKDMCLRFARMGDYVIAPERYARQGDTSKMVDIKTILSTVVVKVPDAQVNADLDAAGAFAGASGNGDTSRLGLVGYCWGDRTAWVYVAHNPKVCAAVSYYGLLDGEKSPTKPQNPVDFAAALKAPVLRRYAGIDAFVRPAVIDQMRAGHVKSRNGSEIVIFPDVNHGFHADYRPTHDKAAATYAQKLTTDWLRERGV